MDGDQLGAVGEGPFDLDLGEHLGDPVHHLPTSKELPAQVHQLGNGPTVTDELQQLGRDKGNGFGVIEFQSTGESLLGDEPGVVKHQLLDFARTQVHQQVLLGDGPTRGWVTTFAPRVFPGGDRRGRRVVV
ncbi:MAG: hypothetical protein Ct9H300mP1_01360 [Planctomycetaceae bacterium]|nr:MAG: hypothetical protein Ct9H300mP1_01360 [Planctomycetaceae bacterium]